MASFGRINRRTQSPSFVRPFILLFVTSLLLLLLRNTQVVRVASTVATEGLVPVQGVVGRVSEVGANYSKVLLVTDSGSAVSALVQGSRAAGIVRGQYGDTLVMDWILQTEAVKAGDVVITAGLAIGNDLRSLYPKGLVLGRVVDVNKAEAAAV